MSGHRVIFASPPDREKLVAMIDFGNEQWAELNEEADRGVIELYPRRDGEPWVFDFDEMLLALDSAKQRLDLR
jgi:hypothetical protein